MFEPDFFTPYITPESSLFSLCDSVLLCETL